MPHILSAAMTWMNKTSSLLYPAFWQLFFTDLYLKYVQNHHSMILFCRKFHMDHYAGSYRTLLVKVWKIPIEFNCIFRKCDNWRNAESICRRKICSVPSQRSWSISDIRKKLLRHQLYRAGHCIWKDLLTLYIREKTICFYCFLVADADLQIRMRLHYL